MRLVVLVAVLSACGETRTKPDASCPGSVPDVLATEPAPFGRDSYIADFTLDGSELYWTNIYTGTVNRVNLDGSEPLTISDAEVCPRHIAVDSSNVYWITCDGSVLSAPKASGARTTIATGVDCTSYDCGQGIAVDADAVYWADTAHHQIVRWSKADAVTTVIATDVYGLGGANAFAVVDGTAYWGGTVIQDSVSYGALRSASVVAPKRLNALLDAFDLVDAVTLYVGRFYAATFDGIVWSVGPNPEDAIRVGSVGSAPQSIAVDSSGTYVDEYERLIRFGDDGSVTSVHCEPETGAGKIVLAADRIVWIGRRASILSLPK